MTSSGYRLALGALAALGVIVLIVLIDALGGGTRFMP
jgi:hypothetical protein